MREPSFSGAMRIVRLTKARTRASPQDLLSAARRREFDVIVAEDSSRIWRNMTEQAPRLAELADLSMPVVTLDLDTRSRSPGAERRSSTCCRERSRSTGA